MTEPQPSSKQEPPKSPLLGRIARILAASLLLLLIVVELGTRIVSLPGLSQSDLNPSQEQADGHLRTIGHPYLAYVGRPDWMREAE